MVSELFEEELVTKAAITSNSPAIRCGKKTSFENPKSQGDSASTKPESISSFKCTDIGIVLISPNSYFVNRL